VPDPAGARLDAELVRRGLVRSRALATQAITEGRVSVDGVPAVKPSARVSPEADLAIDGEDGYVSRAARKLVAGLDAFEGETWTVAVSLTKETLVGGVAATIELERIELPE
jgi:23S rRNA (cytidine1920-2'-O)/16S rRNA (cytidine1409-2'-O)-methyltransferase